MAKKKKAKKKRTTKTKKPTGLTITRKKNSDDTWIFAWEQAEKYDKDQQMEICVLYTTKAVSKKTGKVESSGGGPKGFGSNGRSISVKNTDKKKTVTIGKADGGPFYPSVAKNVTMVYSSDAPAYNFVTAIQFRVRGYHKGAKGWSDWSTKKIDLDPPPKPQLGMAFSEEASNVVRFDWAKVESETEKVHRPFTRLTWQTSYEEDGKTNWSSEHHITKNGHETFTVNQTTNESKIRRFRIRQEGPGGYSDWVSKYHVFAKPCAATVKSAVISQNRANSTITATVSWTLKTSSTVRPADKVIVQYQIGEPNSSMNPVDTNWTDADSQKDTSGKDYAEFKVNAVINHNQCFWVRIKTSHDGRENWSAPYLAKNGVGKLTPPTISNIVSGEGALTITLGSYSGLASVKIAVVYSGSKNDPYNNKVIGLFESVTGSLTKTIAVPEGATTGNANLGVYAFFGGTYTSKASGSITVYTISKTNMESITVWGDGDVPKAPTGLSVSKTDDISTVQATWNFAWASADGSEVSWADHEDAWYSTNEPSKYVQSKLSQSKLNIAGLEPGKVWYFRVRLYKTNDSGTDIFGPYCDIYPFELIEQPVVPVLTVSPDNQVTRDGSLVASWVYVSSDETQQGSAVIAEVDTSTTPATYIPKLQFTTEQSTEISPTALDWETGTTHNIAVKVISSASAPRESDWSEPVPINIVEPAECHIDDNAETGTSLDHVTYHPDPNIYTGTTAEFTNSGEDAINNITINVQPSQDISEGDPSSENICPITGISSDTIVIGEQCKNLLPEVIASSTTISSALWNFILTLNADKTVGISGSMHLQSTIIAANLIEKSISLPAGRYYYSDGVTLSEDVLVAGSINGALFSCIYTTVNNEETRIATGQSEFTLDSDSTVKLKIYASCRPNTEWTVPSNTILRPQIESVVEGEGGSEYVPYYNTETLSVSFGQTIFGGVVDLDNSSISITKAEIASYAGEELPGKWISDRDIYFEGNIPTIGAQVVYDLETPQTVSISSVTVPTIRQGLNTFRSTAGQELSVYVQTPDYYEYQLNSLPMSMRATGAGTNGTTTYIVEKWVDFDKDRPSETNTKGYSGETIIQVDGVLENQVSFSNDDLYSLGTQLDDGCTYRLQAIVEDIYGQVATDERIFTVNWSHQALPPECSIEQEEEAMFITPLRPEGALDSDFVNIYRLSSDKPELIYRKARFNETYVDPYPTIGEYGGYRIVYVTENGDYTIEDGTLAMEDFEGSINTKFHLIDYDGHHMEFKFNVDTDHSWDKTFTSTHYLGGSIQGDWLAGVEHTGSMKGNVIAESEIEPDTYRQLRDLADYAGVCHVRMLDGSNFTANLDVSDSNAHNNTGHPHSVTLNFTKVDNPELDGMTLDAWRKLNS